MSVLSELADRATHAERILRPVVCHTPLTLSRQLSHLNSGSVYLKCEHLQHTGSFKFRGAYHKMNCLQQQGVTKVITASTGNHGQGVALAAQKLGVHATVYVPHDASPLKVDNIRYFGADIETVEGDALAAERKARHVSEQQGVPFISPYNDMDVMAGQGSIAVELLADQPDLDAVFVSVGGGGLIAGIASYLKVHAPNVQVVGCWPEHAPAMYRCMQAGEVIEVPEQPTLSDGTAGGVEPGAVTLAPCMQGIDQSVLVSEREIQHAMRDMAEQERWIIEGAAGVAVAAFQQVAAQYQGKTVAIVLCGRNITFEKFLCATKKGPEGPR